MEHLVTTTFYGGPRRVPCLRDRGHGIGMGGEGKGGRTVPRDFRNGEAQKPMENTGHDLLRVENISLDKRFRLY